MNTYADDLAVLMDALDLKNATIVGFSAGLSRGLNGLPVGDSAAAAVYRGSRKQARQWLTAESAER
jgi:pimeloyl-ACP methyl ester carboxylesterase